jgi:hypothetical protein
MAGELKVYLRQGRPDYILTANQLLMLKKQKKVAATNLITNFAGRWIIDWRMLPLHIANA